MGKDHYVQPGRKKIDKNHLRFGLKQNIM